MRTKKKPPKNDLNIGKNGITPGLVLQVKDIAKKKGTVKIRVLKNALGGERGAKEIAEELALKTGKRISDSRGNTFTLS